MLTGILYPRTTVILLFAMLTVFFVRDVNAQTTAFTYQGHLNNGSVAANGSHDFQFTLFDALTGGNQIGTVTKTGVAVTGGLFTVALDFGAAAFPGADRWLEIRAKKTTDATFTTLTPRQQIGPNPYAIRAQNATNADTATNATQLGGVAASQYVTTTNGPTNFVQNQSASSQAASFNISGNGSIGGNLTVTGTLNATLPAGSGNYVQNTTTQQASSNFNISGDGVLGGTLTANIISATSKYNIGSNRIIGLGDRSTYVGVNAGPAITTGNLNTFLGNNAGLQTADGSGNTFIGFQTGKNNTSGAENVYVGNGAGTSGNGNNNTFVGVVSGFSTSGTNNTFMGITSGFGNTGGSNNVFIGASSAWSGTAGNTTGQNNTFIGASSGQSNTTENNNTFIGANSTGAAGITSSTAIGSGSQVTVSNGFVLGNASSRVGIGTTAPNYKLHIVDSGFPSIRVDGTSATGAGLQLNNTSTGGHNWGILSSGASNSEGTGNLVITDETGGGSVFIDNPLNVTGAINTTTQYNIGANRVLGIDSSRFDTFLGVGAGAANSSGSSNVFLGKSAGIKNTSGSENIFIGASAGQNNLGGGNNVFIGDIAGLNSKTSFNTFVGWTSGSNTTSGANNSFFGSNAGPDNTTGSKNVFIGSNTGAFNSSESSNTFIGYGTAGTSGVSNSTAIGANAQVTSGNSLVLGSINGVNGASSDTNVGIGTTAPNVKLHISDSNFPTMRIDGSNTAGTGCNSDNTAGGHTWSLISAGTGNSEGAGNLIIGDGNNGGHITMGNPLVVPGCTGCTIAISDRNLKSNISPVDSRSVLERLVGIPIQTWNYSSDKTNLRHMGPMAQDFFAAFGLGDDDKHINLIDEGGVALAAIQELHKINQAKDKQIDDLTKRVAELEKIVQRLAKQQ